MQRQDEGDNCVFGLPHGVENIKGCAGTVSDTMVGRTTGAKYGISSRMASRTHSTIREAARGTYGAGNYLSKVVLSSCLI